MSKDEQKVLIKEALKEWLDEKFSQFGKWTFYSLAAAFLVAAITLILKANGWSLTKDSSSLMSH